MKRTTNPGSVGSGDSAGSARQASRETSLRSRIGSVLLGLFVGGGAGCGGAPEKAADQFVDLYFVEVDQARAKLLATGLAEKKLDDELRLVDEIRKTMDHEQSKPTVFYTRRTVRVDGEHANVTYDLTIKYGGDETRKNAMLSLERKDGAWRVANWLVAEGHLPAARP
jgi:hypothetical protein